MRQKFRRAQVFFLLIALTGLGWGGASAATAAEAGGSLSLNQAIDLALKEHPAIRQYRETSTAARYNIGVARAAYLPQVNFVSNYYYGNSFSAAGRKPLTAATGGTVSSVTTAAQTHYFFYQFQATQLLYDFGKTPGLI